jgi:HPt (histidine-containing phosphotransfer) domain-containing protein
MALLDRSVIAALEKAMSPAGLQGFMTLFVEDSLARMDAIADGIAANDFEAVARAAHNLVYSAGNVGAVRMSTLARALDHAARAEDAVGTATSAAALKTVREETLGALRALRPFDQAVA